MECVWPRRVRVGWADYTLRPYDRGEAQEPDRAEETLASSMADGLSCVARDNPELWDFIGRYLREEPE